MRYDILLTNILVLTFMVVAFGVTLHDRICDRLLSANRVGRQYYLDEVRAFI